MGSAPREVPTRRFTSCSFSACGRCTGGLPGSMFCAISRCRCWTTRVSCPSFTSAWTAGRAVQPGQHLYSPEAGGTLCPSCGIKGQQVYHMSVNALKTLRYFRRSSLEEACSLRLEPQLSRELTNLLSSTLKFWLDREIRSKTFLERLA